MKLTETEVHTLREFQQNPEIHLSRLKETGRAEFLKVDGIPQGVLIGTDTYEEIMVSLDELAMLKSIQRGLDELEAGKTYSASEVHAKLLADELVRTRIHGRRQIRVGRDLRMDPTKNT